VVQRMPVARAAGNIKEQLMDSAPAVGPLFK
jgi:hypothetical protein